MNDAEQYLQMAARWSQSSKESAIALNNLGTFSWLRLGQSMAEGSATDYEHFLSRDLLYFSQKSQSGSPILTEQQVQLLNEALNYWEEAIEECTSDTENSTNAQQVRPISISVMFSFVSFFSVPFYFLLSFVLFSFVLFYFV